MTARRKIAVTGASGFIGRALSRTLIEQGHDVIGLVRSEHSLQRLSNGVQGHLTDYSEGSLMDAFSGVDSLVHLAARRSTRKDVPGAALPFLEATAALLDPILMSAKAQQLSKIVSMSSIAVYSSKNTAPYKESHVPRPLNMYGLSKYAMELAIDIRAREWPVEVTHLRLAACYGAGEKETGALMKFASLARAGETLRVSQGGSYQIDQIYIKDAVHAIISALNSAGAGAVNIGSGVGYSVLGIAETVNLVANNKGGLEVEPGPASAPAAQKRHMSIDKARQILKWVPTFDLNAGLSDMQHVSRNPPRS